MRKRGARHRHPLLDILNAKALRPRPDQQAENLQPALLSKCAELINKIAGHDISSIIEILNPQVRSWPPRNGNADPAAALSRATSPESTIQACSIGRAPDSRSGDLEVGAALLDVSALVSASVATKHPEGRPIPPPSRVDLRVEIRAT